MTHALIFDGLINSDFFQVNVILQSLLSGLGNGALYGFVALTLALIFRTSAQLNFAQGEMAMFGAFLTFTFSQLLAMPLLLSIVASMIVAGLGAAAIYLTLIRPVRTKDWYGSLVVILAVFLILNSAAAMIWGTSNHRGLQLLPGAVTDQIVLRSGSPNVHLTYAVIGYLILLLVTVLIFELLQKRTRLGLAYRAVSSNPDSAALVGIGIKRIVALGWAMAAVVGVLVGVLMSQQATVLNNNLMINVLLFGFAAAALGGFDSISGAAIGGLIVGLIEALIPPAFTFLGTELNTTVAMAVIFIVLLIRPNGIFGSEKVARA